MPRGFFPSEADSTIIIDDPEEVERHLQGHFGFGVVHCHQALLAGHARAALATPNSALSQFGTDFYFGVVEELRSQLAPRRYRVQQAGGLELARRQDNRLQITTFMAEGAGNVSGNPQPKNPKGSSSERAIRDNQGTLGMLQPGESWHDIETWWVLYQVHGLAQARSVTAEMSLPHRFLSRSYFDWMVRLILPTLELNAESRAPALPEPARPVEVPITRRVG